MQGGELGLCMLNRYRGKQEIDEENFNSDREKVYFSLSMMKGKQEKMYLI